MEYFKMTLKGDLPPHIAGSVERRFQASGLIVVAPSEWKAREWASRKTGVGVRRGSDGLIPLNVWLDDAVSDCVPVEGPVPKPTRIVAGVDTAEWHLDEDQREKGPDGEQIAWWPCSLTDRCAV
jgi:hypothetical protein